MDGEIGALLTAQGPDPMVRSPVTGAVNIAVISAAVHALAEQFDELGLHEAASGWEHEGSENWSTEQRLQVDTLLQRLEGLRSSMNEVLHDPDPSALRASLSDGMLEQALTADVLSGDETIIPGRSASPASVSATRPHAYAGQNHRNQARAPPQRPLAPHTPDT